MKVTKDNLTTAPKTPIFPKTIHELRPNSGDSNPRAQQPKRENIFSKSRDTREDRGTRQMKTSDNSQTQSH